MYAHVENKHIGRTWKFWILIPLTISSLIIELVFSKQQTSMCYNQEQYMIRSNGGLPFHIGTSNIKQAGREVPNRFLCLSMYTTGQTLICYMACYKHSLMSRNGSWSAFITEWKVVKTHLANNLDTEGFSATRWYGKLMWQARCWQHLRVPLAALVECWSDHRGAVQ